MRCSCSSATSRAPITAVGPSPSKPPLPKGRCSCPRRWNEICHRSMKPCFILALLCLHGAQLLATDFECRWAATPPKIDGKLDDEAWKNAQVVEEFTSAWLPEGQRKPPTATKARLLWDREYLYFSAEMEDWDVFANVTEQDAAIWTCDVFELFFKPAKDKPGYYEFEVNAANGKLDMFLPSRGAGGYPRHARERDFHMESAVQVHGTLNNWSDK